MAEKVLERWHKQESRPVRPFRSADEYLRDVGLRLYADQEFVVAQSIHTDAVDVERLNLALRVPTPPTNFQELVGIPASALRLVVILEDRIFKDSEVVLNEQLIDGGGAMRIIDIPRDAESAPIWTGDIRVHVAVVLADARPGEIGTAQRVGSWVARKTFFIGKVRDSASFAIEPVEPEYFQKQHLPKTTTYLVEIADSDLNQGCENLPDLVKVCLAKEVHTALARDEESPMARALIKSIYVDVVTTVLATGYANLDMRDDVRPDSILDVVTTKLSKSTGISKDKLRVLAGQNAGARLRAIVQADAELSRALVSAAQRR